MGISVTPTNYLQPDFVGLVEGVDLREGCDADGIEAAISRFAVLVFRDQPLTDEQQLAFSRGFGSLAQASGLIQRPEERRINPELADISNLDQNNNLLRQNDHRRMANLGNQLWHSDHSFKTTPAKYSILSARVIPDSGGDTEFSDMRAAYDALGPDVRAQVDDLVCEHSLMHTRSLLGFEFSDEERRAMAPVSHRLVRPHPITGRRALYLSSHVGGIAGWPVPEARAFIRDLMEHATQREFVYVHKWRPNDLVMWDNRMTMHRGRRYDESQVRDLRRTTIIDKGPMMQRAA